MQHFVAIAIHLHFPFIKVDRMGFNAIEHLEMENANLGSKIERLNRSDSAIGGHFQNQAVIVCILANAGIFYVVVDEADGREGCIDNDLIDHQLKTAMSLGRDVTAA
ncbi:MAG: hypothetical protein JW384_02725 [Nitrosomonadaceae bacterium]|nr:hypothetical protein [Nitrosomonadaceae bacterium]